MTSFARLVALATLVVLAACSSGKAAPSAPDFNVPDRAPGVRAPLTAACETLNPTRCLLPWPSSTFTKVDSSTATGLRVDVDPSSLIAPDSVDPVNLADGFSWVTPLVVGFTANIGNIPVAATGQGPVRLFFAQHGASGVGASVPLRFDVEQDSNDSMQTESFIFSYPLRPLQPNSDYVGCVMDDLPVVGAPLTASRGTTIALGLTPPETLDEAKLAAYHAPTRAILKQAGVDPKHVLVVWDFTTRSVQDPLARLAAMQKAAVAAVTSGKVGITLTSVDTTGPAPIAAIVEGTISGLPEYIDGTVTGASLTLDASGLPMQIGTRTAPFRIVMPVGTGDYPAVMYGHGTGGSYEDTTLDADIAGVGAAKVAIQYDGWTAGTVVNTFFGLTSVFKGVRFATQILMQALADGAAIEASLKTVLGDTLSAPMLMSTANPMAGRRPDTSKIMWAGGSLGGILSLVSVCSDTNMKNAVLNVPGAAWTHFVPGSLIFQMIAGFLQNPYNGNLNVLHSVAMSQGEWDEIDGAAWMTQLAGRDTAFLIQESIGDPVVPNPGSEMVAVVTDATQVGAVLVPIPAGIPTATEVDGKSAITQFEVTSSDPFDIHGFAAQSTPAGAAARSQIAAFVQSVYAGAPKITVPAGCPSGNCNFSGQ